MQKDDTLMQETSISAGLEQNGIALKARSRAVAALDRLLGSFFDLPAAYLEGVSSKVRLKDEIRRRLEEAQALVAEQTLQSNPVLGSPLINGLLQEQARKQSNTAGVAAEAIEALKELHSGGGDADVQNLQEPEVDIDEDWMNQFTRYAEDVSSEQLQQLWGRILAGEVCKPGSFSRRTLRFIAELDKDTAQDCQLIRQYKIYDLIPYHERWDSGKFLNVRSELEKLGLIETGGGMGLKRTIPLNSDGMTGFALQERGLVVRGKPEQQLEIPFYRVTRLGEQVMSLLTMEDEVAALRDLSDALDKSNLYSTALVRVASSHRGRFVWSLPEEVIWTAPAEKSAE